MNILIVDDERLILLGLKSVLEKNKDVPCIVETASSAEAALHKLEVFPTDLMITDVEMPSVNGLELIRTVQNRKLCSHFIILSGHDSFDYAKTAIRYGVKDYLLKPVDRDELNRNICTIAMAISQEPERRDRSRLERLERYREYFLHVDLEMPYLLSQCVAYIKENYEKGVTLSTLAERMGRSENYLASLFKDEWGITFLDFVNELRMKRALYFLLYEPEMPVKDISLHIGYSTERQLYRLIESKTGRTPMQIRNDG